MDLGNMKITGRMLRTVLSKYSSVLEKYSGDEYSLGNIMNAFGITIKDIEDRVEEKLGKKTILSKESSVRSILSMYRDSYVEDDIEEEIFREYGHEDNTIVDSVQFDKKIKREDKRHIENISRSLSTKDIRDQVNREFLYRLNKILGYRLKSGSFKIIMGSERENISGFYESVYNLLVVKNKIVPDDPILIYATVNDLFLEVFGTNEDGSIKLAPFGERHLLKALSDKNVNTVDGKEIVRGDFIFRPNIELDSLKGRDFEGGKKEYTKRAPDLGVIQAIEKRYHIGDRIPIEYVRKDTYTRELGFDFKFKELREYRNNTYRVSIPVELGGLLTDTGNTLYLIMKDVITSKIRSEVSEMAKERDKEVRKVQKEERSKLREDLSKKRVKKEAASNVTTPTSSPIEGISTKKEEDDIREIEEVVVGFVFGFEDAGGELQRSILDSSVLTGVSGEEINKFKASIISDYGNKLTRDKKLETKAMDIIKQELLSGSVEKDRGISYLGAIQKAQGEVDSEDEDDVEKGGDGDEVPDPKSISTYNRSKEREIEIQEGAKTGLGVGEWTELYLKTMKIIDDNLIDHISEDISRLPEYTKYSSPKSIKELLLSPYVIKMIVDTMLRVAGKGSSTSYMNVILERLVDMGTGTPKYPGDKDLRALFKRSLKVNTEDEIEAKLRKLGLKDKQNRSLLYRYIMDESAKGKPGKGLPSIITHLKKTIGEFMKEGLADSLVETYKGMLASRHSLVKRYQSDMYDKDMIRDYIIKTEIPRIAEDSEIKKIDEAIANSRDPSVQLGYLKKRVERVNEIAKASNKYMRDHSLKNRGTDEPSYMEKDIVFKGGYMFPDVVRMWVYESIGKFPGMSTAVLDKILPEVRQDYDKDFSMRRKFIENKVFSNELNKGDSGEDGSEYKKDLDMALYRDELRRSRYRGQERHASYIDTIRLVRAIRHI